MKILLNLKILSLLVFVSTIAEKSTESFGAYEKLFYKSLEDIDTTFSKEANEQFNENPNLKYTSPVNAILKRLKYVLIVGKTKLISKQIRFELQ